jgi:hypothetical protein
VPVREEVARATGIDLLGSEGSQPFGYALAGPVATAIGARAFLACSAASMFMARDRESRPGELS